MYIGATLLPLGAPSVAAACDQYLRLRERVPFDSIEITLQGVTPFGAERSLWPWEFTEERARLLRDFAVGFPSRGGHLPFISLAVLSPNPRIRDESVWQFEQGIAVAARLGLNYLVVHAGEDRWGLISPEEENALLAETFGRLAALAGAHGITLTLETGEGTDVLRPLDRLVTVVRMVNSPHLRITLDTGHASLPTAYRNLRELPEVFGRYGSLEGFARAEGALLRNVHVQDNDGTRDQHLPPGRGRIAFDPLFRALAAQGFAGSLTLELYSANVEHSVERLGECLTWLRERVDAAQAG